MTRHTRLIIIAALMTAFAFASSSLANAYPLTRSTPKVALDRETPPTTAECVAATEFACYDPAQLETAYNMKALYAQGDEGQGETIAIVDSFGSPTIEKDLKKFDKAFHLPAPPSFNIIQPAGAVKPFEPGSVEMSGWALETSLDVEYAHSMAPKASILLVETPEEETEGVQGFPQIVAAENYVIEHGLGQVISQSFAATEQSFPSNQALLSLRSAYENADAHGVTVLAGAGDTGVANPNVNGEIFPHQTVNWPASDPLVTGVGGTQLHLDEEGQPTSPATAWDELLGAITVASGGGKSKVFSLPSYQGLINTHSSNRRAVPDISMSAAVNGGVLVYTSYRSTVPGEPAPNSFSIVGGTSEATPLFSGVVAIADQIAGHSLGLINPRMYQLEKEGGNTGIVDVTSGNNTYVELEEEGNPELTIKGYGAKPGYDLVTGLGTVDAFSFAHALAGG
jgi:subtilase family serine protease